MAGGQSIVISGKSKAVEGEHVTGGWRDRGREGRDREWVWSKRIGTRDRTWEWRDTG